MVKVFDHKNNTEIHRIKMKLPNYFFYVLNL